jgi:hypothetical protein
VPALNLFEVMKDAFGPFMDGEKNPLHVGEVMNLWFYLHGTEQTLRYDQHALNLAMDPDLREKLQDIIENIHRPMINELTEFFKKEAIPLPDLGAEKLIGDFKALPEGARMNDEEIANLVAYNLVVGITAASRGITESVRSDVGYLFAKYQMMKITYSLTFKALMQEKGWLRVPPYYYTGKQ